MDNPYTIFSWVYSIAFGLFLAHIYWMVKKTYKNSKTEHLIEYRREIRNFALDISGKVKILESEIEVLKRTQNILNTIKSIQSDVSPSPEVQRKRPGPKPKNKAP